MMGRQAVDQSQLFYLFTSKSASRGVDDYKSDPAGNAGARIACGVIT